ncbi:hypothetical protein EI555_006106, partial [Monodon monoceros]
AAVAPTASQASAAAAGTRYSTRPSSDRTRSAAPAGPPQPQPRPRPSLTLANGRRRRRSRRRHRGSAPRRRLKYPSVHRAARRVTARRLRHCARDSDERQRRETLPPGDALDPTHFRKCRLAKRRVVILVPRVHPHSTHPELLSFLPKYKLLKGVDFNSNSKNQDQPKLSTLIKCGSGTNKFPIKLPNSLINCRSDLKLQ